MTSHESAAGAAPQIAYPSKRAAARIRPKKNAAVREDSGVLK
jgi:hypothetical protein